MKEQILKYFHFVFWGIVLSSLALIILNGISSPQTYISGGAFFIYMVTYIIYPQIRKLFNLNKKYSFIYFTLLYFMFFVFYIYLLSKFFT